VARKNLWQAFGTRNLHKTVNLGENCKPSINRNFVEFCGADGRTVAIGEKVRLFFREHTNGFANVDAGLLTLGVT
jgi:hypothetical protein